MDKSPTTTLCIGTDYVDWSPVLAGAVVAATLSFVLLAAGAAIGLTLNGPYTTHAVGKYGATLAAAWGMIVTIGSFLAGGYIAGRLRAVWGEDGIDEIEFRDGLHGLLVWSLAIFFGGLLVVMASLPIARSGAFGGSAEAHSPARAWALSPVADLLLRGSYAVTITAGQPAINDVKDEAIRVLASSVAAGSLSDANRAYLLQIVANRAGVSGAEAEKRVDAVYADASRAIDDERRAGVLLGLVTTTALMFGLAAAWYAAQRGGHHRDHDIPAKFVFFLRQPA